MTKKHARNRGCDISAVVAFNVTEPTLLSRSECLNTYQQRNGGSAYFHPALLLGGVMLLTIFEGAFRKWVFASNPLLRYGMYFSKDILFLYAGYLGWQQKPRSDMAWFGWCALLIIVPSAGATLMALNPVGALLSLRAYVLIPACAYFAASLLRDYRDIERCLMLVAPAVIVVALLSIYQYSLPPRHFLNRYDTGLDETHIVFDAGHVRATGTFAYISGMAMLAGFAAWAGALLTLPMPSRPVWIQALGLATIVSGFVCIATSMSRGGLVFWGATLVGSCLLYFRPKQILSFLMILFIVVPFALTDRSSSGENSGETTDSITTGLSHRLSQEDFFVERVEYVLTNLLLGLTRHPLGEGLGSGQPGGAHATGQSRHGLGYESEWGRIAFEIGPIGLAAVLFIRIATCRRCWQSLSQYVERGPRSVLAATLPYFAVMSLGWMAFNHTGNSFSWAAMTCGLAIANMERGAITSVRCAGGASAIA